MQSERKHLHSGRAMEMRIEGRGDTISGAGPDVSVLKERSAACIGSIKEEMTGNDRV